MLKIASKKEIKNTFRLKFQSMLSSLTMIIEPEYKTTVSKA